MINLEENMNIINIMNKKTGSEYIDTGLEVNGIFQHKINKDIETLIEDNESLANVNYYAYLFNLPLHNNPYVKPIHTNTIRILERNGVNNYGELLKERSKGILSKCWLESAQCLNIFPKEWRQLMLKAKKDAYEWPKLIPIKLNIWKTTSAPTTKELRERIEENNRIESPASYLEKRHHMEELTTTTNPFQDLLHMSKETKLRDVQYKILHNIYPTMYHLFKWKIKETSNCSSCGDTETTLHAIYECPIANRTYNNLKRVLREHMQLNLTLTLKDVLLGMQTHIKNKNAINCILLLLKRRLILQREDKREIGELEIIGLIKEQIKKELFIAKKTKSLSTHNKRWGTLSSIG